MQNKHFIFLFRGVRGVPEIIWVGILIFLLLRSPCKISKPQLISFREKSNEPGRRRERKRK
jgi:hypothetical protein